MSESADKNQRKADLRPMRLLWTPDSADLIEVSEPNTLGKHSSTPTLILKQIKGKAG
jgi:hypothetical protein